MAIEMIGVEINEQADRRIEARTGREVRELWERGGEAAYRPLEREETLAVLTGAGPDVLAVPAGAVVDAEVLAALRRPEAFVVWLRVEVAELAARVTVGDHRPLLGDDPEALLAAQSAERSETYAAVADVVLDAGSATPDHLAMVVVAALRAADGDQ